MADRVLAARSFLPLLRDRPEAHLVDASSLAGGPPPLASTAKALQAECAGTDVRLTVVLLGENDEGVPVAEPVDEDVAAERAYQTASEILDGMERNASRVLIGSGTRLRDRFRRRRVA